MGKHTLRFSVLVDVEASCVDEAHAFIIDQIAPVLLHEWDAHCGQFQYYCPKRERWIRRPTEPRYF